MLTNRSNCACVCVCGSFCVCVCVCPLTVSPVGEQTHARLDYILMYFQRKLCYNATCTSDGGGNNINNNYSNNKNNKLHWQNEKQQRKTSPLLVQVQPDLAQSPFPNVPRAPPLENNNGADKKDNSISGQKSWFELLYIFHTNTRL